jgi:hypothetical protein
MTKDVKQAFCKSLITKRKLLYLLQTSILKGKFLTNRIASYDTKDANTEDIVSLSGQTICYRGRTATRGRPGQANNLESP